MPNILVVDDEASIRELLGLFLREEGFDVAEAADGEEALRSLERSRADLVVLDIMMPGMDGWELCRAIRDNYDMPLLMVTAKGEAADRVKGFRLGTDDYVTKPFDPLELVLRVKALLKRYHIAASQTLEISGLTMDKAALTVKAGGHSFMLPLKEFELLFKLASYPNQIFTRAKLIEDIWGFDYEGDERTVDVHVKRLREKLDELSAGVRIATIRGLGYRLEVAD